MASNLRPVNELEARAEQERERVTRRVAELRQGVKEFDVRHLAEDRVHSHPGLVYGFAAATALLAGYLGARVLKL